MAKVSKAEAGYSDGKLDKWDPTVNYMGPDRGPFSCYDCIYFLGNNKPCVKVRQAIKKGGCCNKFE